MLYFGGINTSSNQDKTNGDTEKAYKADETPIKSKDNLENTGLAVFSGDVLVGELNNIETLCHLIVSNKLQNATITIPNPYNYDNNLSIYIGLNKKTKTNVKLVNNYPYIEIEVFISGNVLSLDDTLDLSDETFIKNIEDYVNTYLTENIYNYLYKTSKDFKSDIDNFGRKIVNNYLTWQQWVDSDWLNNYENSFFNVKVNTNIRSGYLFTKI